MGNPPRYGGLDAFKVIAALLVVAIHTSPLTTYSPDGDFLLTRSLARVAVPFFFMVTDLMTVHLYTESLFDRAGGPFPPCGGR